MNMYTLKLNNNTAYLANILPLIQQSSVTKLQRTQNSGYLETLFLLQSTYAKQDIINSEKSD
jgi:hypothetical protein